MHIVYYIFIEIGWVWGKVRADIHLKFKMFSIYLMLQTFGSENLIGKIPSTKIEVFSAQICYDVS